MKKLFLASSLAVFCFGANVEINDIYARKSIAGVPNSAVFMKIKNNDAKAIKVVSADASSVANKVELHTHIKEGQMMKMMKVPSFEIPANAQIELKPGGDHVMLMGLKNELKAGDKISLKLDFSDNTSVELKDIEVKDLKHSMAHH